MKIHATQHAARVCCVYSALCAQSWHTRSSRAQCRTIFPRSPGALHVGVDVKNKQTNNKLRLMIFFSSLFSIRHGRIIVGFTFPGLLSAFSMKYLKPSCSCFRGQKLNSSTTSKKATLSHAMKARTDKNTKKFETFPKKTHMCTTFRENTTAQQNQ